MGSYKIDFYQISLTPTADVQSVRAGFSSMLDGTIRNVVDGGRGYTRELFGLTRRRRSLGGVLRKFRTSDLPAIGAIGRATEDIPLGPDQGVIEENFFVYYREHDLLGWHINAHGSHPSRFAEFLSAVWDTEVVIEPVIQPDAARRLMSGGTELKKIIVTIPRPTNPDLYPNDNFSSSVLTAMGNAGADTLHLEMGVDLRRSSDNRLARAVKQTLRNLHSLGASTAKATVIEDGFQHTIDLIADRVSSRQRAETDGRPPAETMYGLIDDAREECSEAIDGYFGTMENALD